MCLAGRGLGVHVRTVLARVCAALSVQDCGAEIETTSRELIVDLDKAIEPNVVMVGCIFCVIWVFVSGNHYILM